MDPHDALHALADEYYAYLLSTSQPMRLWDGKLEHLERWDRFTPAEIAARNARLEEFAARADALAGPDGVPTDPDAQKDYVLRESISLGARGEVAFTRWDPALLAVNPRMGLIEDLFSFVDNFPLATADHGDAYLAMLRAAPDALAELGATVRESAEEGVVALASHLRETARVLTDYVASPAGPEERLAAQAPPSGIDEGAQGAWREERDGLLVSHVRPAFAALAAVLTEVADSHGRPDSQPGLCHLPGGDEAYRAKVFAMTYTDHTPEQIHALGLSLVTALEDEYRAIAGPLLGTTDVSEIYERLRTDESLKYRDAATLIADAEVALARATDAAPAYFARTPESACRAVGTDYGAMAYYSTPDPTTGKPGTFYFKTSEPHAWSTYELEAIVYHESIPGHHLQLALHVEDPALHKVVTELGNTAYIEGWGLYTERLADEMGLYTSELSRVGMLSADSLRAGRLVVDTGLHALGWTRDEAIQYLLDHTPLDRAHIEQEVDRYIGLPGQAVSYMIGRLEIIAIRAAAEARPGFDIRTFHDMVLRNGSVPLPTLRRLVLG